MKKLAHCAKQHNVTYHTAWNHFHAGLIENAYQLHNGTMSIIANAGIEAAFNMAEVVRASSSGSLSVLPLGLNGDPYAGKGLQHAY